MSNAWETTVDDVLNVVQNTGAKIDLSQAEKILNELDVLAVEKAVLYGDDMETQTTYAYEEITKQIVEGGLI